MENDEVIYNHSATIHSFKELFLTMNEWGITPIVLFFTLLFLFKDHLSDKKDDKRNDKLMTLFEANIQARDRLSEAIKEQTDFFRDYIKQQDGQHKEIISRLDEIKTNQMLIITDKICKKMGCKDKENA